MSMAHRNLLQSIQIHPTLIIFVAISFITGTFIQLFIILTIVTIHELGHFYAARYFGWRVESIVLWAFGGVMKTDEYATRPIKEELIVILCGPLQHLFIFIITYILQALALIPDTIIAQIMYFNFIILLFNLLPIYPLDGSKFTLLWLSLLIPYRQAYRRNLILSFISAISIIIMQLVLLPFTLTATMLILFLLGEIIKYYRNEYFTFTRFLLHRLHHEPQTDKIKHIYANKNDRLLDLFNQFMRHKYHRLYATQHTFISEKKALHIYFNDRKYTESLRNIIKRK